jgi:hypothetical protein
MIGFSLNAYAQTSDLIALDQRNNHGQFSIDNVHVVEKQYYKVIFMDVHVKVKDLALEDVADVYWTSITLTNENGKKYSAEGKNGPDCKKEWDGTFWESTTVKGSDGGIGMHSLCYMVEKEFHNFKVYYTIPFSMPPNYTTLYPSVQIGDIILNQSNDPTYSGGSNPSTSSPSVTNFFEQLMNYLKQIFHFMILDSPFLNDS